MTDIVRRIPLTEEETDIIQRLQKLNEAGLMQKAGSELRRAFAETWQDLKTGKITKVHVSSFGTSFIFISFLSCLSCLGLFCRRGHNDRSDEETSETEESKTCCISFRQFWSECCKEYWTCGYCHCRSTAEESRSDNQESDQQPDAQESDQLELAAIPPRYLGKVT